VSRVRSRGLLLLALGTLGLVALVVAGVLACAALDWPSETIESEVTVDAPVETVWKVLTDFEGYDRWNPLVTSVEGDARLGSELDLDLELPDGDKQELTTEITTFRPERKLRWQSRELLPGIADREYEVILESLDDGLVRVLLSTRFEGVLVPLNPTGEEQVGLDLMAEALKKRAEGATPGTTIRTNETWLCDRPLEDYGDLPITVKSKIDNAAVQPQPVDAVTLSGPDCAGDGDPNTIDLVLEVEGDGSGVGPSSDAVKVKLGAHDIEISGFADCGAQAPGVRQNGIHVMLGYRITFVDFRVGDLDEGLWTCDGDGGALSIEERSEDDPEPEDVVCVRCAIISGNRSLYIGDSVRSGSRDSTFVSDREVFVEPGAEDPVTTGNTWRRLEPAEDS
jgi:hypothetical protein